MPPWYVDKTVGIQKFANDRSLSDHEIDLIARWVDAGAPQGNPRDLPAAKAWPTEDVWEFADVLRTSARPRREVARLHDAGRVAGPVVGGSRHARHS